MEQYWKLLWSFLEWIEKSVHSKRVSFWSWDKIGTFSFEHVKGMSVKLSDHFERFFCSQKSKNIGKIQFQQDGAILDVLRPVFQDRIISSRVNIGWPPWSCGFIPLDNLLWGSSKCLTVICELQLHTIDNVFESWTNRVVLFYFFYTNRKNCTFK